jgi:hypothetical protein
MLSFFHTLVFVKSESRQYIRIPSDLKENFNLIELELL